MQTGFAGYLDKKYLEWQKSKGRGSLKDWSEYLEIPYSTLLNYQNGYRLPNREMALQLARKLGPEVFDMLGMERPDRDLAYVTLYWERLDDTTRQTIIHLIDNHLTLKTGI